MGGNVVIYPSVSTRKVQPISITISIGGQLLDNYIAPGPIPITLSLRGSLAPGQIIVASPIPITILIKSSGVVIGTRKCNWVKWSKIGYLDFTIDETNVAGERPLDWPGCIYQILKLDKSVIAYGENGVTILTPEKIGYTEPAIHWGIKTIHRLGLIGRMAVAGNEFEHYFVDRTNKLYKMSGSLELLDYSEYISKLTNPKLSLDVETGLLYICDGEHGYVYSTKSPSFGEGPGNVSGIGSQNGTLYVVAPEAIEVPKFHICTDTYDLGSRKPKTIQWIEVGTNLRVGLQAKVEYRLNHNEKFKDSAWVLVNPGGIAYVPCYGVEFRFHVRSFIYEYFEFDYMKIVGVAHGYTQTDSPD